MRSAQLDMHRLACFFLLLVSSLPSTHAVICVRGAKRVVGWSERLDDVNATRLQLQSRTIQHGADVDGRIDLAETTALSRISEEGLLLRTRLNTTLAVAQSRTSAGILSHNENEVEMSATASSLSSLLLELQSLNSSGVELNSSVTRMSDTNDDFHTRTSSLHSVLDEVEVRQQASVGVLAEVEAWMEERYDTLNTSLNSTFNKVEEMEGGMREERQRLQEEVGRVNATAVEVRKTQVNTGATNANIGDRIGVNEEAASALLSETQPAYTLQNSSVFFSVTPSKSGCQHHTSCRVCTDGGMEVRCKTYAMVALPISSCLEAGIALPRIVREYGNSSSVSGSEYVIGVYANSTSVRECCLDQEGVYDCVCEEGYKSGGTTCSECKEGVYGEGCDQMCSCHPVSEVCNDGVDGNGDCTCKSGREGINCDFCYPLFDGSNCTDKVEYGEVAYLLSSSPSTDDGFGWSLSQLAANNTVFAASSESGGIRIFQRTNESLPAGNFSIVQVLPPTISGVEMEPLAISAGSGGRLAGGAPLSSAGGAGSGEVYVWSRPSSDSDYTLEETLTPPSEYLTGSSAYRLGEGGPALTAGGDLLAAAAPGDRLNGSVVGAVIVWRWSSSFQLMQRLSLSEVVGGGEAEISNTSALVGVGQPAFSADSSVLVCGVPLISEGYVNVWEVSGGDGTFTLQHVLRPHWKVRAGRAVGRGHTSISADYITVAASAPAAAAEAEGVTRTGVVVVWKKVVGEYVQHQVLRPRGGGQIGDGLGESGVYMSEDGRILACAAPFTRVGGYANSGAVHVWVEVGEGSQRYEHFQMIVSAAYHPFDYFGRGGVAMADDGLLLGVGVDSADTFETVNSGAIEVFSV
mmetsp:Transcript_16286/g.41273  ORF Transcript_16286/g.41273 Transcript_16286/m.41273 type:complete len:860 (-) Transcript_16286:450-3029(-)